MNVWDLFKLDGYVAIVTGGARHLGYDMAEALAQAGADVVVTSRTLASAQASAKRIRKICGRKVLGLQLEVTCEENVADMVARVLTDFGKINILVNNAGRDISIPGNASLDERPLELWDQVIATNLTGPFLCSKHVVAKAMKPARSGNIINLGSTAGIVGKDRRQYRGTHMAGATLDYHASKGGVISMTRDMAVYLAPYNIRVNCISPCGFRRSQPEKFVKAYSRNVPMGRMGIDGKEIKGAVVFLASEASSYVTGHNLVVDGGLTAW